MRDLDREYGRRDDDRRRRLHGYAVEGDELGREGKDGLDGDGGMLECKYVVWAKVCYMQRCTNTLISPLSLLTADG